MQESPWLFTLLITAGPQSFQAVNKVVSGEPVDAREVRRSYVLSAVFTLGFATVLSVVMKRPDPMMAGLAIVGAAIVTQEFALALKPLEGERE